MDIQPDEPWRKQLQKSKIKSCHVSLTMVNNVCNCQEKVKYPPLESLDNAIEIDIDSEIDYGLEDSFNM